MIGTVQVYAWFPLHVSTDNSTGQKDCDDLCGVCTGALMSGGRINDLTINNLHFGIPLALKRETQYPDIEEPLSSNTSNINS